MITRCAVFLIFVFSPLVLSAATSKIEDIDVIVIRDKSTIGMHAPKNYFLDKSAASDFGLCAFYVKTDKTFHDSPAVLYSRISDPGVIGDKGIETLVKEVSDSYKGLSKNFKLEKKDNYNSKNGLAFVVRYFLNGPSPNNFEAAAYLKLQSSVVIIIFSTKTEQLFSQELPAFYELLDKISPYSTQLPALSGNCLYPQKQD